VPSSRDEEGGASPHGTAPVTRPRPATSPRSCPTNVIAITAGRSFPGTRNLFLTRRPPCRFKTWARRCRASAPAAEQGPPRMRRSRPAAAGSTSRKYRGARGRVRAGRLPNLDRATHPAADAAGTERMVSSAPNQPQYDPCADAAQSVGESYGPAIHGLPRRDPSPQVPRFQARGRR